MWTAPDGSRHDSIPQRWRSAGRTIELAGAAALARRRGWVEDAVPAPAVPTLAALRTAALARIRAAVAAHILATYPDWYQRDCALGIYPEAAQTACRDGIAACIEASNAAEDLVAAATEAAGVAAAEKALVLPEIAR